MKRQTASHSGGRREIFLLKKNATTYVFFREDINVHLDMYVSGWQQQATNKCRHIARTLHAVCVYKERSYKEQF